MKAKKKYLILLLFSLLFVTCTDDSSTEAPFSKYQGTWLWIQTSGGLFPRVTTPPPGTTVKIIFDSYGLYHEYRNDSLKVFAKYNVSESNQSRDKISFSEVTTFNYHFYFNAGYAMIKSDTLDIWDGNMDGYFSLYKKIK